MSAAEVANTLAKLIVLDETLGIPVVTAARIGLLLAVAGVRPPIRVLTTREELADMREGTIIREVGSGFAYEGGPNFWWRTGDTEPDPATDLDLPVEVLWEPSS